MTHTATITDPREPDAMPMWESFDHDTAQDAYRAAHAHIETAHPEDRIVDEGHGVYAVLTAANPNATQVATIVISQDEDPETTPADIDH